MPPGGAQKRVAVIASSLPRHHEQGLSKPVPWEAAREFLRLYIPLAVVLTVAFAAFEYIGIQVQQVEIKTRESSHEQLARNSIIRDLKTLGSDLLVLANGETMKRMLNENTPEARQAMADRYLIFSRDRRSYDQIRFIDETGMEVVRVNFNGGAPAIVAADKLQDKSHRYYFKDTFALSRGELFVSRFDLNTENNKVEEPYKPMLRLGKPVFDSDGRKRGIVILNYLAENLLTHYTASMPTADDENFVLNGEGYWLYSSEPENEWGFMFGRKRTFATDHPEAWKRFLAADTEQFETEEGFFSFTTIYPARHLNMSAPGSGETTVFGMDRFWKIGSFLSAEQLSVFSDPWQRFPDMIVFALLLSVAAAGSWNLGLARITRRRAEVALRDRIKIAELLEKIATAANEASDTGEAMQNFVDLVCAFTDWPVGHVYMVDEDTGSLYSTEIWHLDDPHYFETFARVTMQARLVSGIGLPGRVLADRKPVWIGDATKDANFPRANLATDIGVKGGFAFPVLVGDRIEAVLEFFTKDAVEAGPMLLEITSQIGTHLGRVIERDQTRKAVLKAKEESEQASRAKSEFLASMSHELRTPLNAILGFADILSHQYFGPIDDKYREYAGDIYSSGEHLLTLVNEILDLSTIEAGKQSLVKDKLYAQEIIAECVRIVGEKAYNSGIKLITEVSDDLPPLYADRRATKQILINLLSNAVKFTPTGGKITVSAKASKRNMTLKITDTGRGIPAEKLPNLTDPFTQVDGDPYLAEKGWGLGLSITKSLIDLHDGTLDIKSEVGEGTTVTVTFPNGAR